jgi:hypothetical protein
VVRLRGSAILSVVGRHAPDLSLFPQPVSAQIRARTLLHGVVSGNATNKALAIRKSMDTIQVSGIAVLRSVLE